MSVGARKVMMGLMTAMRIAMTMKVQGRSTASFDDPHGTFQLVGRAVRPGSRKAQRDGCRGPAGSGRHLRRMVVRIGASAGEQEGRRRAAGCACREVRAWR